MKPRKSHVGLDHISRVDIRDNEEINDEFLDVYSKAIQFLII